MESFAIAELERHGERKNALGRVMFSGRIEGGRGVLPKRPMRVYDSYAVVLITAGRGRYVDANGFDRLIAAGDLIYVVPGFPHAYGPDDGTTWDEYYIVFDGIAAAALVDWGIVRADRIVVSVADAVDFHKRMQEVVEYAANAPHEAGFFRLASLLAQIADVSGDQPDRRNGRSWIATACRLLGSDLKSPRPIEDIAAECGIGYSLFRRTFREAVGTSPGDFRNRKRIDTAKDLLKFTSSTLAQIAEQVGFSDQYHFSKQFKLISGVSPSDYRRTQGQGRRS
jgi:AraC-like DNA-binding protein